MAEPSTAAEVARAIADALEEHGFRYAIGGAIALGYHAPPRATIDVDVNVFIDPAEGFDAVLRALSGVGFEPDEPIEAARRRAVEDGQFRGWIAGLRVDVFVPAVPFYAQLEQRRRRVPLLERPLWIVGAEDLVILKMMFFRRKDLADVEEVLKEQGESFDRAYVRAALVELVGADDERVRSFDEIARDAGLS